MEKDYSLLDKLFGYREEELSENIEVDTRCFKQILKNVKQEDIIKLIENLPDEYNEIKKDVLNKIDELIANYNIKISYYNKKYYKQGFKDAIDLFNTCKE